MNTYTDPECGMIVGESSLRAKGYDDIAFCAPGCRATFLADPAAYSAEPKGDDNPEGRHNHDQ